MAARTRSTNRRNASGTSQSAQSEPAARATEAARKVPRVEMPAPASVNARADPTSIPPAIEGVGQGDDRPAPVRRCAPLEQGVERHEQQAAEDADQGHQGNGHRRARSREREDQRGPGQPQGTEREQAVLDLRAGELTGQHGARPDADPERGQGAARLPVVEPDDPAGVGQDAGR